MRRRNMTGHGSRRPSPRMCHDVPAPNDLKAAILKIMGSPDMCSRRWVWEQYDHLIQSNTAQIPGGDAAVIRFDGTPKALAVATDVTPRYVEADPFEGGKQAVAECWRNLTAVGADPIAVTDNLNFGNPERPEIMGTFVRAIEGIGEACRALDFPVVSGNVSLYNETNGQAILPDAHDRRRRHPARSRGDGHPSPSRRQATPSSSSAVMAAISASRSICARFSAARKARRRPSISPARSAMATS